MAKNLNWETYRDQISGLGRLEYNYDEKMYHAAKTKKGWHIDHYTAVLAQEPAGDPLPDGPFAVSKNAIQLYQFPDPNLITAVFDPNEKLLGRNMLMFAKFMGFTFTFGVRVTGATDERRTNQKGEPVQAWGYSYRTLKGHFEVGEIRFEISKNLKTGEVLFVIDAYSKPDRIPNLFYRMGFLIFSRPLQKYFAQSSIERLQKLSQEALAKRPLH